MMNYLESYPLSENWELRDVSFSIESISTPIIFIN